MLTALALAWKWFLGTTLGRWIVGIGAVLAAIAVLAYTAFLKGKHAQADTDKAKDAEQEVQAVQQATELQHAAQQAADAVPAPKAPDPVKRDDLDTTQ